MASMFFAGEGVPQSNSEGIKWLRAAGEQNLVSVQIELGNRYHQGIGVAKDFNEGTRWFQRAAELGSPEAQLMLSYLCLEGKEMPRNVIEGGINGSCSRRSGNPIM